MTTRTIRTYRLCVRPDQAQLVDALLAAQGFGFEPDPFFPLARRLTCEPFALGASVAASFGLIYIQDRSSMLPPVLLDAPQGSVCLDMCASPGGKTGILSQLAGPQSFVLACEPSHDRLATLRQNLRRMNALNTATAGVESQKLALAAGVFERILLDPPCSGWGTVDKNPKVLELWTPEKAEALVKLQRELLERAVQLLAPGGELVFSTCTTNVRENEDQAAWAREFLGLEPVALAAPEGFAAVEPARADTPGVLRVGEQRGQAQEGGGQGFFLARFRKPLEAGQARAEAEIGVERDYSVSRDLGGRELAEDELLAAAPLDPSTLPPGEVREFGGKAYFLHEQALGLGLSESGLRWQGFLLGATSGGRDAPEARGRQRGAKPQKPPKAARGQAAPLKLDPRLRSLLPPAQALAASRRLDVEEVGPLLDLLSGRSLEAGDGGKGPGGDGLCGLYFRGLPLGWLTKKGRRLLWSDR